MKNPTLLSDIQDNNNYLDDGDEDKKDSDKGPEQKRKANGFGTDCLIGCLKVLVDCNLFSAVYEYFMLFTKLYLLYARHKFAVSGPFHN